MQQSRETQPRSQDKLLGYSITDPATHTAEQTQHQEHGGPSYLLPPRSRSRRGRVCYASCHLQHVGRFSDGENNILLLKKAGTTLSCWTRPAKTAQSIKAIQRQRRLYQTQRLEEVKTREEEEYEGQVPVRRSCYSRGKKVRLWVWVYKGAFKTTQLKIRRSFHWETF